MSEITRPDQCYWDDDIVRKARRRFWRDIVSSRRPDCNGRWLGERFIAQPFARFRRSSWNFAPPHDLKVVGSNPTPATKFRRLSLSGDPIFNYLRTRPSRKSAEPQSTGRGLWHTHLRACPKRCGVNVSRDWWAWTPSAAKLHRTNDTTAPLMRSLPMSMP